MTFENGPYLQAAVFCQDVIEDRSGVLSLIRLIDTLTTPRRWPIRPARCLHLLELEAGRHYEGW